MASTIVCVMKGPDEKGGLRLTTNHRHVNQHSAGDQFLIPDIHAILQRVGGTEYISCFDTIPTIWQSSWTSTPICDVFWTISVLKVTIRFEFVRKYVHRMHHPHHPATEGFRRAICIRYGSPFHDMGLPYSLESLPRNYQEIRANTEPEEEHVCEGGHGLRGSSDWLRRNQTQPRKL